MTTKRSIIVCTILCLLIITGGCREQPKDQVKIEKGSSLLGYRNVREYLKGNVRFRCRPIEDGKNYSALLIGCPAQPYTGTPSVRVKLPDDTIINLSGVDVAQVLRQKARGTSDFTGAVFHDIGSPSMDLYGKWPDGTLRLQIHGWVFHVHSNRLISFRVSYTDYSKKEIYDTMTHMDGTKTVKKRENYGSTPAIGRADEDLLYNFPLTQEQVIHVFGKPDKIREYLEQ